MASPDRLSQEEHARVRVSLDGEGASNVGSGLPVLDHLLGLLARYGSLDLELAAGARRAGGRGRLGGPGARAGAPRNRSPPTTCAVTDRRSRPPTTRSLTSCSRLPGRPLVVSNVDLSEARVGGLGTDLVASFLHELAEGGGFTLHVRLIDGDDPQHVLEAIFKALGVALAQAGRPRKRRE